LFLNERGCKTFIIMISSEEACQYVQQEIPEISDSLPPEGGIYNTLNVVREYACQKAREHNYNRLRACFMLAAALYEKGSNAVKCAVENVFVYSISRIFSLAPEDRQRIKSLTPQSLQSLYTAQVHHHGY
jgi:hypothetical protein